MKNKTNITDLKVGDKFVDAELYSNIELPINYNIIGDHIYTITDGVSLIMICGDEGNGHGVVLQVTLYEDLYQVTAKRDDRILSKQAFVQKGALVKMANGYVNDTTIEAIAAAWETINRIK